MITRENKLFRLSWLKSDLFRATSTETAYNARTLEDETGQDLFDRYAMTNDERPFFDEHIAQALLALLHHFRRIVPDCQPITTEGDTCGLTFAARVSRDEDEFYSHAELQGVERSATEVLRYYILANGICRFAPMICGLPIHRNSPQPSPRCHPTCSGFTVPYYDAPIRYLRTPKNIRITAKYKSLMQVWFDQWKNNLYMVHYSAA